MSQIDESEEQIVRFGFTATGSAKHIIDDWSSGYSKSVCNISVRDWDEMIDQFHLDEDEAEELLYYDWCGKCNSWLKKMRYLKSAGVATSTPEWVIDLMSEEFGYTSDQMAEVIDFLAWKKERGYA